MKHLLLVLGLLTLTACSTPTPGDTPPVVTNTPLEKADAPIPKVEKIVVEEWFDYGCGHCRTSHQVIKNLKAKYGDQLEVRERHYPLSAQTFVFAEASECARAQGRFAEFHDQVFTKYYGQYNVDNLSKIATAIDLPDLDTFNTCVSSGAQKDKVTTDVRAAQKLGVKGTPYFQINGELGIPGAISQASFESLFDQLLVTP